MDKVKHIFHAVSPEMSNSDDRPEEAEEQHYLRCYFTSAILTPCFCSYSSSSRNGFINNAFKIEKPVRVSWLCYVEPGAISTK